MYDENSISILSEEEAVHKIPFVRLEMYAKHYSTNLEWITGLFEVAMFLGIPERYIVEKYLDKRPLPMIPELQEAYKEMLINKHTNHGK